MTGKKVDDQTILQFNIKWFFGLVFAFLSILWGYHSQVLGPTITEVKETSKTLQETVKNLEIQVEIQKQLNDRRSTTINLEDLDSN